MGALQQMDNITANWTFRDSIYDMMLSGKMHIFAHKLAHNLGYKSPKPGDYTKTTANFLLFFICYISFLI